MRRGRRVKRDIPFKVILPNMITSGNLLCGVLALVSIFRGEVRLAAVLVFLAALFDYLDGKVARQLGGSSLFGLELDSLADVVSFCVVPSMLVYSLWLDPWGIPGALLSACFVICGAARLARFNIQHVSSHFVGLPTPASGSLLASLVLSGLELPGLLVAVSTLGLSFLMVSEFRYSNLKNVGARNLKPLPALAFSFLVLLASLSMRERVLLFLTSLYALSGPMGLDLKRAFFFLPEEELAEAEE